MAVDIESHIAMSIRHADQHTSDHRTIFLFLLSDCAWPTTECRSANYILPATPAIASVHASGRFISLVHMLKSCSALQCSFSNIYVVFAPSLLVTPYKQDAGWAYHKRFVCMTNFNAPFTNLLLIQIMTASCHLPILVLFVVLLPRVHVTQQTCTQFALVCY